MFITTEQFTGAPDGALMDKPSRALCANAADAGEGRGDGPEGRGDPGQTVNGSRRSRGPTGLTKASVFRFAPRFLQTVLLILQTSTKGRFSHLKTKAGRTD